MKACVHLLYILAIWHKKAVMECKYVAKMRRTRLPRRGKKKVGVI